jgi:shikimate kinase
VSKVLITGMSGTGKSSALVELAKYGYRAVDTDDPGWREYRPLPDPPDEAHQGEWMWVEAKISGLLDAAEDRSLFVQGCVRNQSEFYERFDAIVLLTAPLDVMLDRVTRRTTNPYGKTALERRMIEADLVEVQPLLRAGCTHELNAARPLSEVVSDLITIVSSAEGGGVRRAFRESGPPYS